MGMTITEKILAYAANKDKVAPGEIIEARVDVIMLHDVGTIGIQKPLQELGFSGRTTYSEIVIIPDHFVPPPTLQAAENLKLVREFAKKILNSTYYEIGRHGICHMVMIEKGHVRPGTVIVAPDSHATTYGALGAFASGFGVTDVAIAFATGKLWLRVPESIKINIEGPLPPGVTAKDIALSLFEILGEDKANYKALELTGSTIRELSISGRMTICNMSAEMNAKSCIIAPDEKTISYVKERTTKPFKVFESDPDAEYEDEINCEAVRLEPKVSAPYSPANVKSVKEVEGVKIDQAFLGSCTNGSLEDLRMAARILKGRSIHPDVRMIVVPASQDVYLQALKEGLIETFISAGAAVYAPTCGPCFGGHLGLLADDEVCIATTNRNFPGRMGGKKSKVYLASPLTVAASAVTGVITDPRKFLSGGV